MRALILTIATALFLFTSLPALACNSITSVSDSDGDGALRLAYYSHQLSFKLLELILREEDGVVIARGILPDDRRTPYEAYATLDLKTGNLISGKGIYSVEPARLDIGFLTAFSMQPRYNIKVFAVDKAFVDDLKALIVQYREKSCHDELVKKSQRRDYDKQKCGDTAKAFDKVMTALVQPETASFQELTGNVQYQRYIDGLRAKKDCYVIEKMETKIIDKLRDPKTQRELAFEKKKPSYLEREKGIEEKTTVERYRY